MRISAELRFKPLAANSDDWQFGYPVVERQGYCSPVVPRQVNRLQKATEIAPTGLRIKRRFRSEGFAYQRNCDSNLSQPKLVIGNSAILSWNDRIAVCKTD